MALKGCSSFIKYMVFCFNFLFWLMGIALLVAGIWAMSDPNITNKFEGKVGQIMSSVRAVPILFVTIGASITVIGFLGCCGAIRESQCMLVLFTVVLFLIFVGLVTVAVLFLLRKDTIEGMVTPPLERDLQNFKETNKIGPESLLTLLEKLLVCCGVRGAHDYSKDMGTEIFNKGLNREEYNIFTSTCEENIKKTATGGDSVKITEFESKAREIPGCSDSFREFIDSQSATFGGISIGFGIMCILGMIFGLSLCCAIRRQHREDYYD